MMINNVKDAALVQFMLMNGAELVSYDSDTQCYNLESNQKRNEWRLAYLKSEFSMFSRGMSELINLKKEA